MTSCPAIESAATATGRWVLTSLLVLATTGCALAFGNHENVHRPLHGGVVVEETYMDYELVARPDSLRLYLRNHDTARDVSQASARATWLAGPEQREITLQPAGDKLEAKGPFDWAANTKVVVVVSLPGKSYTVTFLLKDRQ